MCLCLFTFACKQGKIEAANLFQKRNLYCWLCYFSVFAQWKKCGEPEGCGFYLSHILCFSVVGGRMSGRLVRGDVVHLCSVARLYLKWLPGCDLLLTLTWHSLGEGSSKTLVPAISLLETYCGKNKIPWIFFFHNFVHTVSFPATATMTVGRACSFPAQTAKLFKDKTKKVLNGI